MANFMDKIKLQLKQLQAQFNRLVEQVKAWPQYRQIGVGMMVLGLLLLILGIILY